MAFSIMLKYLFLAFFLAAVLGALFWGLIVMAKGGSTPQHSNKIMRYRVILQAIAVLIFVVLLLMAKSDA